ncbi:MAG: phospho-N-acetylmuramoyl-pentapeptide-transferase [bacterium]|jgi:phospho-N-acetylmuramoyl-pentapeptide-transferase
MNDGLWAAALAMVVSVAAGQLLLPLLRRLKLSQQIRDDGPRQHLQKIGTPTMGGIIIILGITVAAAWFGGNNPALHLALFITVAYGLIGFADDFLKIVLKRPLGLRARTKLAWQILIAALSLYILLVYLQAGTAVLIPFAGVTVDLGKLYLPFAFILILGIVNGVNLTDGLDGLAAGTILLAMLAYAVVGYTTGRPDIGIFCLTVAGGCAGFLFYNLHPAQVIMGDTGSLALGGALAAVSLLTKMELLLPIIGGVFVIETLSVTLQVIYFRRTGRRIFRMAPLHHHFELLGWSEWRVVVSFWTLGFLFGLVGLVGLL